MPVWTAEGRSTGGRTAGLATAARRGPRAARSPLSSAPVVRALGPGAAAIYLSLLVLLPLAAMTTKAFNGGIGAFWSAVTQPEALSALRLTLEMSLAVVVLNAVAGIATAWVLVRDDFPGKKVVDALIDLPFALPTIVAGVTLLSLYGPQSPFGVNIAFSRVGIVIALAFVTLPFSVRAPQPLLASLDPEVEEAAASLGARQSAVFRRVVLPRLVPGVISGAGLSFARALGEFGSIVLIAGNLPFRTELASVRIFALVQTNATQAAAAVSVVLLVLALVVLSAFEAIRRRIQPVGAE